MNYVTIDIEGDAMSRDINKKLFPEGGHYDPETRIWCMTMYNGEKNITFVCKLPEEPRTLPDGTKTKAIHKNTSHVPQMIDKYNVTEFTDYKQFINRIQTLLGNAKKAGYTVFFKGYGIYNYDRDMLKMKFEEQSLDTEVLECMKNINKYMKLEWPKTTEQVTTGKWIDNQEYMIRGIKHNIEDAIQLYNLIKEKSND